MLINGFTWPRLVAFICIIVVALGIVISSFNCHLYWPSKNTIAQNNPVTDGKLSNQPLPSMDEGYLLLINERVKRTGLTDLKNEILPNGGTEIRFWVGFSHEGFRGLVVKNDGTTWLATFVPNYQEGAAFSDALRTLAPPLNGWQYLEEKLRQFYNLPIERNNARETEVFDATSVIVEVKTPIGYRIYSYHGIFYYEEEKMVKMREILKMLSSEFSIKLY